MSCFYEPFYQVMETPTSLCSMTMLFVVNTLLDMISLGWVHSDGSRPPEVGQVLYHRKKLPYDTVRGVRGGSSWRLCSPCLRSHVLGWFGGLELLSASLLDVYPVTKICWVAACTSSSSIEYLLAHRNRSSIVVGGFLASHSNNEVPGHMLRLKIWRTASML